MSAPELIYAHSERGFALVSQRTESIQRLYMQCPIDEDIDAWSNQQIWDEMQARVEGDGFELRRGPIFERALLRFRSFVAEPMRWGRLVLAGDAAHTVPPTGAKGLNLALNDVRVLGEVLAEALETNNFDILDQVRSACSGPGVEIAELLLLDDPDAAPAGRGFQFRR